MLGLDVVFVLASAGADQWLPHILCYRKSAAFESGESGGTVHCAFVLFFGYDGDRLLDAAVVSLVLLGLIWSADIAEPPIAVIIVGEF